MGVGVRTVVRLMWNCGRMAKTSVSDQNIFSDSDLDAWGPSMSSPDYDFRLLMQRISEGSEEAAWELVEQHGEALRRAVRRALDRRLRTRFDSLDFVQQVWSSFFRTREHADRVTRPEELVALLVGITRNKVNMAVRRHLATEKRDLNRERLIDREGTEDHQATPEDMAIARERWSKLMEGQPNHYRQIICMKLQGYSCPEIAQSLNLAETTVRRFLDKLLDESSE